MLNVQENDGEPKMDFKPFCENYEESEKQNSLTKEEQQILKQNGFIVAKDGKTAVKKLGGDFFIDAFSDKKVSTLLLKMNNILPEIELYVLKNKYITEKILKAFLKYSEEKIKNLRYFKST